MKRNIFRFIFVLMFFADTRFVSADFRVDFSRIFSDRATPITAVEYDSKGNIVVLGFLSDPSQFPSAKRIGVGGGEDVFVAKLSSDGQNVIWVTIIGGSEDEFFPKLLVTADDQIYFSVNTRSLNYPLLNPITPSPSITFLSHLALSQLSSDGQSLLFSTYFTGADSSSQSIEVNALATNANGDIYLAGKTGKKGLPNSINEPAGNQDCFLSKLQSGTHAPVFTRYIGGADSIDSCGGMALDSAGNVNLAGDTYSEDFPVTSGAYQMNMKGIGPDLFLVKIGPTGDFLYGTYLGGDDRESFEGNIVIDSKENIFLSGRTHSSNFPVVGGSPKISDSIEEDGVLCAFNKDGQLVFSTHISGKKTQIIYGLHKDSRDRMVVVGHTSSDDFFVTDNAIQKEIRGATNGFLRVYSAGRMAYSTFYGGTNVDAFLGSSHVRGAQLLTFGITYSGDFPTTIPGSPDGYFITEFNSDVPLARLTLSATSYSVVERELTLPVVVERADNLENLVSVTLKTTFGTASNPSDFDFVNQVVTFDVGETSKTISISIVNDTYYESPEIFFVTLSNPSSGAVLGDVVQSTVTIYDDLKTVHIFSASQMESNTNAFLRVDRRGDPTGAIGFDYEMVGGTAEAGLDFVASTGTLYWADGDMGVRYATVTLKADTLIENDETVLLKIKNVIGIPDPTILPDGVFTIRDYQGISCGHNLEVSENVSGGVFPLTCERLGNLSGPFVITVTPQSSTAVSPEDYLNFSESFNWIDGQGGSKTLAIPIVNDAVEEDREVFWLNINYTGNSGPGRVVIPLAIDDDDAPRGVLSFSTPTINVGENAGSVTFTVTRSSGSSGSVEVNVSAIDGSAQVVSDYNAPTVHLTWADGNSTSKKVTLPMIINDTNVEGTETFFLLLSGVSGGATLGLSTTTVTIEDDDVSQPQHGTIRLEYTSDHLNTREDIGHLHLKVLREGGTDGEVSVHLQAQDKPLPFLPNTNDYVPTSKTLIFPSGDATPQYFDVEIINDNEVEPFHWFQVEITSPTGGVAVEDRSPLTGYNFVIVSEDLPVPNAGPDITTAPGTVVLATGTIDSLFKDYPVGVWWELVDPSSPVVLESIEGDSYHIKMHSDVPGVYQIRFMVNVGLEETAADVMTLTVEAPPVQRFALSTNRYEVNEGSVVLVPVVRRLGPPVGQVAVEVITEEVSAADPEDFYTTTRALLWADGDTSDRSFNISIVPDSLVEGDETFRIRLVKPYGGPQLDELSVATATIVDNDFPSPSLLSFVEGRVFVNEEDSSVSISVQREGGASGPLSVDLISEAGSALESVDYHPLHETVTWADGESGTRTIVVPLLIDDNVYDPNETFTISLQNVVGDVTMAWPQTQLITIRDDKDLPQLEFAEAVYQVEEGAGGVRLKVHRLGGPIGVVSAVVYTSSGSAKSPSDYTEQEQNLVWEAGDNTDRFINVMINPDFEVEGHETFTVRFKDVRAIGLGSNKTATVTILDDDVPGQDHGTIRIEYLPVEHVNVPENIGTLMLKVLREGGTDGAVSVDVHTMDIDPSPFESLAGIDYEASSRTIYFANGDNEPQFFFVKIINDNLVEPSNEGFLVVLDNVTGGAIVNEKSYPIFIHSDDIPVPNAGPDLTMVAGSVIYTTATIEAPFNSSPMHFTWELVDPNAPVFLSPLDNANDFFTEIRCNIPGIYQIRFRVDVGFDESRFDVVTVTVLPKVNTPPPSEQLSLLPSKNIFSPTRGEVAEINYSIDRPGHIQILIYDRLGREIKRLLDSDQAMGSFTERWDGRDSSGERVNAGVYIAFIKENDHSRRLKIIVLD